MASYWEGYIRNMGQMLASPFEFEWRQPGWHAQQPKVLSVLGSAALPMPANDSCQKNADHYRKCFSWIKIHLESPSRLCYLRSRVYRLLFCYRILQNKNVPHLSISFFGKRIVHWNVLAIPLWRPLKWITVHLGKWGETLNLSAFVTNSSDTVDGTVRTTVENLERLLLALIMWARGRPFQKKQWHLLPKMHFSLACPFYQGVR